MNLSDKKMQLYERFRKGFLPLNSFIAELDLLDKLAVKELKDEMKKRFSVQTLFPREMVFEMVDKIFGDKLIDNEARVVNRKIVDENGKEIKV